MRLVLQGFRAVVPKAHYHLKGLPLTPKKLTFFGLLVMISLYTSRLKEPGPSLGSYPAKGTPKPCRSTSTWWTPRVSVSKLRRVVSDV